MNKYKNEIENLINNLEFDKEIKSKLKFFRQMKLKNLSDFVNKYKNQKNINIFLRCDLNITENDLSRIDMSIPTINKLLNCKFINKGNLFSFGEA